MQTLGAKRRGRGRRRPRAVDDTGPAELPVTRVTAIDSRELDDGAGADWLERTSADEEARAKRVEGALQLLNLALHAQGVAAADPYVQQVDEGRAVVVRIGYGSGDEVAEGRWRDARELPAGRKRERRADALRPQERLAAVLGGRDHVDACETLLLRARLDLDCGRSREAALQLRVGLEALLAELSDEEERPEQGRDLEALSGRRRAVGEAANDALGGELSAEDEAGIRETLELCERVLRRRRHTQS